MAKAISFFYMHPQFESGLLYYSPFVYNIINTVIIGRGEIVRKKMIKNILAGSLGFIGVIAIFKGNKTSFLPFILFFVFYSNITWDYIEYELKSYNPELVIKINNKFIGILIAILVYNYLMLLRQVQLRELIITSSIIIAVISNILPFFYIYLDKKAKR